MYVFRSCGPELHGVADGCDQGCDGVEKVVMCT